MYRTRPAGLWLYLASLLAWVLAPCVGLATCLGSSDPAIRELQGLVDQNGAAALKRVQGLIGTELSALRPDPQRLASLYAVEAQSYGILELDREARASASKGLELAARLEDPVRLDLLSAFAEGAYDEADIASSVELIQSARAGQPLGSLGDTCLLVSLGLLQYRQDRNDLAIASLTQAYHAAAALPRSEPRILAAGNLSTVLRSMGDYTQALALNQEAIEANIAAHATLSLSVSRYLRGMILDLMGRHAAAIDEYGESRKLSVQVDDSQGIAFADLRICDARIELGELDRAEPACTNASILFGATKTADEEKETQSLLARIDLANGHPEKALATLNGVLDHGGTDLLPRRVAPLYEWRARANADLHNYREAYADLAESLRRYLAANDVERTRQSAALRARFDTDREIERNTQLKRELNVSQERSQKQALQLRWNTIVVVLGFLVIALLVHFLLANLRFKKQLVKLASQDALTGLPNRRRTAELAMASLEQAGASRKPLIIAIIDMDHFKVINDRCGHATGDFVLQEFARMGREALRPLDVLGRWGGEEFLLILPDSNLEMAQASLQRIRTLLFGVRLPSSGAGLRVSLSAGLAIHGKHGRSLDVLIARADAALYAAKNEGRDLVKVADESYLATTAIRRAIRQ